MNTNHLALLLSTVLVLIPAASNAQRSSGDVSGVVLSQDGLRLPGATITARNADTGEEVALVISNDLGAFRVSSLAPGHYTLVVSMPGFESVRRENINLAAGRSLTVDVALPVAGVREVVTVSGSAPRESLEATEVRASSGRDIGEALSEVPGLTKVRRGAIASDVVLRGYQGRNLTVLIDGVRLYGACPNNMDPTAFHADFAEVERIDVGKGPFDVRNQGSLGGVMNVVTKRPQSGTHVEASMAAGSASFVNPSATLSFGGGGWSALGGASYRRASPYNDGSGRSMTSGAGYTSAGQDSSAFGVGTAWIKAYAWPDGPRSLQVAYTRQDASHVLYPYLQMDALSDVADRASVAYQTAFDGSSVHSLRVQTYYSRVAHWMTDELRTSGVGRPRGYSMATDARTSALGGKVETNTHYADVGVEAYHREWTSTTTMAGSGYAPQYAIPSGTVRSLGLYAERDRPLGHALRLDLGARLDYVRSSVDPARANMDLYFAYQGVRTTSATDTAPSAKARLTMQLAPGLELSGGVGRTVRIPDPQERYYALKRMGSDWVGNPALRPTTNTGLDASVAYRNGRVSFSGSAYYDVLTDFVSPQRQVRVQMVPGVMNAAARSFANVDARMRGGEGSVAYAFTDHFQAIARLSYTRGTRVPVPALGLASPNLPEMPPARATLGVRYQGRGLSAEIEGAGAAAQRYVDAALGELPTPGFGVMNARASWGAGRLRVAIAVSNVLNNDYYEHLSYQRDPFRSGVRVHEPGRNAYMNLALAF